MCYDRKKPLDYDNLLKYLGYSENRKNDNLEELFKNLSIDDVLVYDYSIDQSKVVEAVKEEFGLEFSPKAISRMVIRELMADELRFYQQKELVYIKN